MISYLFLVARLSSDLEPLYLPLPSLLLRREGGSVGPPCYLKNRYLHEREISRILETSLNVLEIKICLHGDYIVTIVTHSKRWCMIIILGGTGQGWWHIQDFIPPKKNFCLSDFLLIGNLYKLKVFNICEKHGTGGREVVVFDRFQQYVEIVRKLMKKCYNSFIFPFNDLKSKVRCKVKETTLQNQICVCYWSLTMLFGHKMSQNPYHSIVLAQI